MQMAKEVVKIRARKEWTAKMCRREVQWKR
jgi:hypothetical protein